MFSRSCAGHTISTSGHQWSFWPGDRWRHVFGSRLHFYALSAIRIWRPSCYNVRAFPGCSNDWLPRARWNTRNARFANILTCLLFRCSLVVHACPLDGHVGHRLPISLPDFTSMSLNIFHASKIVCKRSVANVFILFGKRVILTLLQTLLTTSHLRVGQSSC